MLYDYVSKNFGLGSGYYGYARMLYKFFKHFLSSVKHTVFKQSLVCKAFSVICDSASRVGLVEAAEFGE